jgi:hypothetical protein
LGPATRLLYQGSPPPLCKTTIQDWWGENLEEFPKRAAAIIKKRPLVVKTTRRGDAFRLDAECVKSYAMAIVNYAMAGNKKYVDSRAAPWNTVPDTVEHEDADAVLDDVTGSQTYWPVLLLNFDAHKVPPEIIQAETAGTVLADGSILENPNDISCGGRKYAWAVCIYQCLLDEPEAWLIRYGAYSGDMPNPSASVPPPPPPRSGGAGVFAEHDVDDVPMVD